MTDTVQFIVRAPRELKEEVKQLIEENGSSMNGWLLEAIQLKKELEQEEGTSVRPRGNWPLMKIYKDGELIQTTRPTLGDVERLDGDDEREDNICEGIDEAIRGGRTNMRMYGSVYTWELCDA